jgi:hypothetical protein
MERAAQVSSLRLSSVLRRISIPNLSHLSAIMKIILILLAISAIPAIAHQGSPTFSYAGPYAGRTIPCVDGTLGFMTDKPAGQNLYTCLNTVWTATGSGVVSITAADGSIVLTPSPLIGTGTVGVGTVPLTKLATQAASTITMNASGSTAVPTAVAIPATCAGTDQFTAGAWNCITTGVVLSGTSASIGGGALAGGACASTTTTVTGAATTMAVVATPVTDPGAGNYWQAFVSSANTVTVRVCAAVAGTPVASTYNIRIVE